ncbi:hypothetical protein CRG98_044238, partial [Punica granatum]
MDFLKEYQEVFAWFYADMPSLDPSMVEYFLLPETENFPPKRQHLRRQRAGLLLRIKEEVVEQINAGFLEVCNYSEWVANIVPVEKDGRVKFSFMDGFSGYNQIRMAGEDKIKTTFITMWGTFCYKVMPFGLKNAGASYQRAMVTLFHDMMHKEIEVYVDDMIAKLNPTKCTFGSKSGKLLGFVVSERGIEVDPDKVKAIGELPPPSTVREVRSFLGRLNYVARFIANLTDKCQPLFRLLRENVAIEWDDECQRAFDYIKVYLVQPAVLVPPIPGRPLILYLTVRRQSLGCMLGQEEVALSADGVRHRQKSISPAPTTWLNTRHASLAYRRDRFQGQWKTKDAKLVPYHEYLEKLAENFEKISFTYMSRIKNQFTDALATLASMVSITKENLIEPLEIEIAKGLAHLDAIEATDEQSWYEDIKIFLRTSQYPAFANRRDRKTLRRLPAHYFLSEETLYRRSFDATLLQCVDENEAQRLMGDIHEGSCGPHMSGLVLTKKLMRLGYFWSTIE